MHLYVESVAEQVDRGVVSLDPGELSQELIDIILTAIIVR
jgi:hypothetical protein